jgi:1A family penicillin-binding protein
LIYDSILTIINPLFNRKKRLKKKAVLFREYLWLENLKRQFKLRLIRIGIYLPTKNQIKLFFIKVKFFLLGSFIVLILVIFYNFYQLIQNLPDPKNLAYKDLALTTKIYDRNEKLLYEIYENENRTYLSLEQIPNDIKNATIAVEDQEFYIHPGYSLRGILRALYKNFTSNNLEGGSTITQQLIRSKYLTQEKTYKRKIIEVLLSIWTEKLYTKNQILEMYLNQVPYGGTAWGIQAAAQTYFGADVSSLNLAQAAFLAGLPASPSVYSPFNSNQQVYKQRQAEVLNRMLKDRYINRDQYDDALKEKLVFRAPHTAINAPHFVMYVKDYLLKYYGRRLVEKGGLTVITTLDLDLQNKTQEIVERQLNNLKNLNVNNGAVLITDPKNGQILTMVGSKDYFDNENDGNFNVTTSLRQPGSTVKVINYALALSSKKYTAASIINDSPISFSTKYSIYSPQNYDGRYHGPVTIRTALASSYNVPAVKILADIGVDNMVKLGKSMGIESWKYDNDFGLSLTLGGGEVTMLDMAKVYATLANGGTYNDLTPIIKIIDSKGNELSLPFKKKPQRVLSDGVAFIISNILSDNQARSPAFGRNSDLYIQNQQLAVKTGTSDSKRDNWTIGYTNDHVITVWVGNNNNSPMHPLLASGVTGASPIWREVVQNIQNNKFFSGFYPPDSIIAKKCNTIIEYFLAGTENQANCNFFTKSKEITPTID